MYYCNIKKSDIADGPGVRVTLFVSGCTHHCEECFQPETWNFTYGQPFTKEVEEELIEALRPGYVAGLTLVANHLNRNISMCCFHFCSEYAVNCRKKQSGLIVVMCMKNCPEKKLEPEEHVVK